MVGSELVNKKENIHRTIKTTDRPVNGQTGTHKVKYASDNKNQTDRPVNGRTGTYKVSLKKLMDK